ncbi:MAG: hypothetical protein ACQEQ7_11950 [Thermodesulfobacteriota bacterium]
MWLTDLSKFTLVCLFTVFCAASTGYAMQPPPPPLNVKKLGELVSDADLIVVGKVGKVEEVETESEKEIKIALDVILNVEKVLKGDVLGETIVIQEAYPSFAVPTTRGPEEKRMSPGQKSVVGFRAGPGRYHGKYTQGNRIIIFLEKITETGAYKPLGSGTYDEYLCEFLIEDDGIKTLYFRFAADVAKHADAEQEFVGLIKRLLH